MIWRWRYYFAAAVFTGYFLIRGGIPPFAVLAGLIAAAFVVKRQISRSTLNPH